MHTSFWSQNLKEIDCEGVDSILFAQDVAMCQVLVYMVMNILVL
jgi:hypothetical protein